MDHPLLDAGATPVQQNAQRCCDQRICERRSGKGDVEVHLHSELSEKGSCGYNLSILTENVSRRAKRRTINLRNGHHCNYAAGSLIHTLLMRRLRLKSLKSDKSNTNCPKDSSLTQAGH